VGAEDVNVYQSGDGDVFFCGLDGQIMGGMDVAGIRFGWQWGLRFGLLLPCGFLDCGKYPPV
jgi:hypothetical protein